MNMSTQLRLITKTEAPRAGSPERPLRGRTTSKRRPSDRRAVHWQGQWRLDDRTREVGRAGVASAREALAAAHPDTSTDLRQAS
jgi:hypothetical protein